MNHEETLRQGKGGASSWSTPCEKVKISLLIDFYEQLSLKRRSQQ